MSWWDEGSRKRGGTGPQNTTLGPHHTSGSLHRPKVKSLSTGPETRIKISGHILQQLTSYKYAVRYCKAARRVRQERVITKQHPGKWPCVPITHSHCWRARPWFKQMTQTWINTERLCVISWFTDCWRVEGALTQPFFPAWFHSLASAGWLEVSGSAEVRGHEESCPVPLVKQRLSRRRACSLWAVTRARFSSVRRRNSSSRRAISTAVFSSSTSSASSFLLGGCQPEVKAADVCLL